MKLPQAIGRALLERNRVALRQLVNPRRVDHVVDPVASLDRAKARAPRLADLDVATEIVADLVWPDAREPREPLLDGLRTVSADHWPIGPKLADDIACPIAIEVELVDEEPSVVVYLEREKLAVVLAPRVARAVAASLENAADRVDLTCP